MPDRIEEFFARYPNDVQAISRALRGVVLATLPNSVEVLYAAQNHIGYGLSERSGDRIVYICPMQDYVRLGFMFGGELSDPQHLLTGEGKRLRHIKLRSRKEATSPAIRRLLKAAWGDPRTQALFAARKRKT